MQPKTPRQWSAYLQSAAEPVLTDTPLQTRRTPQADIARRFIETFTDERGDRRPVDRPLLAWLLHTHPGPTPADATSTDLRLWWALHNEVPIDDAIAGPPGPILGEHAFRSGAVETTTETELAALHALWHHARREPRWETRCLDAARWHVEMLQPDNATNHPWAVHVFVHLALAERDPSQAATARLYAETLIHNALVASGRPDRFSACLLLDAARVLCDTHLDTPDEDGAP